MSVFAFLPIPFVVAAITLFAILMHRRKLRKLAARRAALRRDDETGGD